MCQQFKINRSLSNPAYQAVEGAKTTRPFAHCSMDLITDLSPVEGYSSILVVVDWGLSKGVILCPCAKTLTWEGAAILLRDNLLKRFGLPDEMISNRDPRSAAHAFQELLKLLKICSNLTTAYHPQSDGAMEQVNQEIEAYLAIYCTSHPEDWLHSLSTLEFTHNNRRHAKWIHTPFELIQGDSPISIPVTFFHTKYPSIKERMKWMINDRGEALAAHELARTRIANEKQSNFTPFEKNKKVWLDMRNLKINHHKEITPKWEGPFEIKEVLGPVTYWLKLLTTWKIHNVFHATLLRPYIKNEIYGNNYPRPLPELLEGEEVHIWSGNNPQTLMKRKRIPILCEMERISNHWSDMGIWISLLRWWKHAPNLQRSISTLTQKDLFLLDDKD